MKDRTVVGLLMMGLLMTASELAADTIRLKNGNVLEGKVESRTEREVVFLIPGLGSMTLTSDEIESISESDVAVPVQAPAQTRVVDAQSLPKQVPDLHGFKRLPGNPETYVHTASGIVFPPTLYVFQRGDIHHFDERGTDVSIGYNFIGAALTIYVYPLPVVAGESPDDIWKAIFSEEMQIVQEKNPGTQLLSAEQVSVPVGGISVPVERLEAFRAQFQMTEDAIPKKSELYSFRKGQQLVKMRLTYVTASEERIIPEFAWALKEFHWPTSENAE